MHGNRKISEYALDGRTSETIFAIPGFSMGIQQGVAISLWVKSGAKTVEPSVFFRDDLHEARAQERRAALLGSLADDNFQSHYSDATPEASNRYSFRPVITTQGYQDWPSVSELSTIEPLLGLNDNRGQALHDFLRETISSRMKSYFDPNVSFDELSQLHKGLTTNAASFNANDTRSHLLKESGFHPENVWPFWFKPFDLRWCYVERHSNLWNRVRPELLVQAAKANKFLMVRRHAPKFSDDGTIYFSRHISDQHALHTDAYFIPFDLYATRKTKKGPAQTRLALDLDSSNPEKVPNLSGSARLYMLSLAPDPSDCCLSEAEAIWYHALAIGHTPRYLSENADGIRQDWPRIPMPDSKQNLLASADLGRKVASLLDTESSVKGVTADKLGAELKLIAVVSRTQGGSLSDLDLELTAKWGHLGKGGVTMPARGKLVQREYSPTEREALRLGARAIGLSENDALARLGNQTNDIYLNNIAYWSNIPSQVWAYTIGGYQVIKKWLSYRELPLLGRPLTKDEVRYVQEMARRIAAILLLGPALDANYESIKAHTFPWPPNA